MYFYSLTQKGAALLVCLLVTLIYSSSPLSAQHNHNGANHSHGIATVRNCHSMEVLQDNMQRDPGIMQRMLSIEEHTQAFIREGGTLDRSVITIPVVVHVIYRTSSENISDAQILSQITVLNKDFRRTNSDATGKWSQAADSEIEFCMATTDPNGNPTTGITRTATTVSSFSTNDAMKYSSSGGKDAWPRDQYLNLWVCNIGGGILGYAQFPGGGSAATDGVVIGYKYFGTSGAATAPFNKGRTATHEVGHWLNLRHIWGDGGCGVDDYVTDTPESDAANYGCTPTHVSCGTADMVENYMDYSDDACMNLFTAGQKTRMRALFAGGGNRVSLLSSTACSGGSGGGGGSTACSSTVSSFPYSEGFESGLGAWSQSSSDNIDWTRYSGSTPSGSTGPSAAAAGSYYMYVEASSPNYPSKTAILNAPCFNLTGISNPELTFKYHLWGATMGTLVLEASTNGTSWNAVWSKSGDQGNAWTAATVSLSAYAGQSTLQLRFKGTTGTNYTGDMAIDDLKLANASTGGGGGGGSTCNGELVSLLINFDNYPAETSWSLKNASNQTVASGNNYTGTSHSQSICLPDGCYDFIINDSYGDGICCSYGNGSYTLTDASGGILASGGSFTSSQTTNFCVGGAASSPCPTIDFSTQTIGAYSTQDNGSSQVQDGGQTLYLANNAWKSIPMNYTVTPSTVIEVEFRSTTQGEIHGIGFDNDNTISPEYIFRLHGTQAWGIANYDNYPNNGSWVTYVIPVGSFYTGTFSKLCFVDDHDVSPYNANSYFRNVRVYEGSCGARTVAAAASAPLIQNEGEGEFFVNLFPNPAKEQLNIQIASKNETIRGQIMDATGRSVWNGKLQAGNNTLNIHDLPAGMYHFTALQGDGKMITLKFVKAN